MSPIWKRGPPGRRRSLVSFLLLSLLSLKACARSLEGFGRCSDSVPCKVGCCGRGNQCGFGPKHCGDGCNCNATAECGEHANEGQRDCPINGCCKYGLCGATDEFCGHGCQENSKGSGCGHPPPQTCQVNTNALDFRRRIGYYRLPSTGGSCKRIDIENLEVAPLTDVNLAYANFGDDFKLATAEGGLIYRASLLKLNHPGLRVSISIGGRSLKGEPTSHWSRMASTPATRQAFKHSVADFLVEYGLDGVELVWEHPSDTARGGRDDAQNYVRLLDEMRSYFDTRNPAWTISAAIPPSYRLLRGFDLEGMQQHLSWFNIMSREGNGAWDDDDNGHHLRGHGEITELERGLDLLRRNNITMDKVVMGMSFFGRFLTLGDMNCRQPNGVCKFREAARQGSCSDAGVLTYAEVAARRSNADARTYYNSTTTTKYSVSQGGQWISYDDEQSWNDKKKVLSTNCLGGLAIWSLDADNAQLDGLNGLMGDFSGLRLEGGSPSPSRRAALAHELSAYTGQECFVTPRCTDGSPGQLGPQQVCPGGFQSVATAHSPKQAPGYPYYGACRRGWYRHICCPRDAMPRNCRWGGGEHRHGFGCRGQCARHQFKLNSDAYRDAPGEDACFHGARSLCCDSTAEISGCRWTGCQGPLLPGENPTCPGGFQVQTFRFDRPDGSGRCSDFNTSSASEGFGSASQESFKSALCCPQGRGFSQCRWSNEPDSADVTSDPAQLCLPRACERGKVQVAKALDPPKPPELEAARVGFSCDGVGASHGQDLHFPYCCWPPSQGKKLPVDRGSVWNSYNNETKADAVWSYSDEWSSNGEERVGAPPGTDEDGYDQDAYGFVMLDGPEGSIDNSFATVHTVVRRQRHVPRVKRAAVTTNQTLLDSVFDHAEETLHIYCNYPAGSKQCERLWMQGAEDTIIRLPGHVGQGPFARLVSIKPADEAFELPGHHVEHRSVERLAGPVYEVKIDYAFDAIPTREDGQPVNLRVDYTNLLGYWDEMARVRMRRESGEDGAPPSVPDWHARVNRAINRDKGLRRRSMPVNVTVPMGDGTHLAERPGGGTLGRRWWFFREWIEALVSMAAAKKEKQGALPLIWADRVSLVRARKGCPGRGTARLEVDLEASFDMDVTYAYHFSGTLIPPRMPVAYAYLGMEPSAYVGLRMAGTARMQYRSKKIKLIDTLQYPGLAIKGIVSVGPSLDIYGQIVGKITLHGETRAGVRLNFGKAELYWPKDDEASKKYQKLLGLPSSPAVPPQDLLEPVFEAGVKVDAALDVTVQPQANIGIKIGGGKLLVGKTIMNTQLSGYVRGTLSFQAHGKADSVSKHFSYSYGIYLYYNIGYMAKASVLGLVNWALKPQEAFWPDRRVDIYGPVRGKIPLAGAGGKRKSEASPANVTLAEGWLQPNASMDRSDMGLVARAAQPKSSNGRSSAAPRYNSKVDCSRSRSIIRLPELRYNCDAFGPTKVLGKGNYSSAEVPGMCQAWAKLGTMPRVLTFSEDEARKARRHGVQCPAKFCTSEDHKYWAKTGRRIKTTCAATPPASSEEGGGSPPSRMCVPGFQGAYWSAASCQKLMRNLMSNWGELDPGRAAVQDNWVGWGENKKWTTAGSQRGNRQRATRYPHSMPLPDGMQRRRDPHTSWMFRRNYTWSVAKDAHDERQWWDAPGLGTTASEDGDPDRRVGWASVLCAMNTFGQGHVYRWKSDYNAFCLRAPRVDMYGFQQVSRAARCRVSFGNGGLGRRSWDVEDVEYLGDPEDDLLIELPVERQDGMDEAVDDAERRPEDSETDSPHADAPGDEYEPAPADEVGDDGAGLQASSVST